MAFPDALQNLKYQDFIKYLSENDRYETSKRWTDRLPLPAVRFYFNLFGHIARVGWRTPKDGAFHDASVVAFKIMRSCERAGGKVLIEGLEHTRELKQPPVIIANHMSLLETVTLGAVCGSICPTTFVVKESLLDYPALGNVLQKMQAISVTRKDAKADLKTVMTEGKKRLQNGVGVIVFPQSTRDVEFDSSQFNSLGVRLAKSAKAPILPLTLQTNYLENGRLIKDFGPINVSKPIRYSFGPVIQEVKDVKAPHEQIVDFISGKLKSWDLPVK